MPLAVTYSGPGHGEETLECTTFRIKRRSYASYLRWIGHGSFIRISAACPATYLRACYGVGWGGPVQIAIYIIVHSSV